MLVASAASAQDWVKIARLPDTISTTPYFINADTGFGYCSSLICSGGFQITLSFLQPPAPGVSRTTNGGQTWTSVRGLDAVHVTQFAFVSRNLGYASAIGPTGGIYVTQNCGESWSKIDGVIGQFSGIYAVGKHVFASSLSGDTILGCGPLWHSRNSGNSWDTLMSVAGLPGSDPHFQFIYGNHDSLIATVSGRRETSDPRDVHFWIVYSTDLGANWSSVDCGSLQGYLLPLFIPPHKCSIIREILYGCASGWYGIQSADYPYSDWKFALELYPNRHSDISAWIYGNSCAMYTPYTADDQLAKMYRSVPNFLSNAWLTVSNRTGQGPNFEHMDDYHSVSVVGHGAIIYASDGTDIWKSTYGAVGPNDYQPILRATELTPQVAFGHTVVGGFRQLSTCQPDTFAAFYQSTSCAYTSLDSIWIEGLGRDEYSHTSLHQNPCSSIPDTTWFVVSAKKPGRRTVQIHARFVDDEFDQIDSTMPLVFDVSPSANSVPINFYLKASRTTVRAGETVSIPVYASANATLGATELTLGFALDTNVLKVLSFEPAITATSVSELSYANGAETVHLHATTLALNAKVLIGTLHCAMYLADTLSTSIRLRDPEIQTEQATCIAPSASNDEIAITLNGCGDSTLLRFMSSGSLMGIDRVTPNPAQSEITVQGRGLRASELQVYDMMGRRVSRTQPLTLDEGISMDVHTLPDGMYYLRIGQAIARFEILR